MHTIVCPACLGAKFVFSRRGLLFVRLVDCRECEGLGEILVIDDRTVTEDEIRIEPICLADFPTIKLSDVRFITESDFAEPSPEAQNWLLEVLELIKRCQEDGPKTVTALPRSSKR